jgi:hypothetical protein
MVIQGIRNRNETLNESCFKEIEIQDVLDIDPALQTSENPSAAATHPHIWHCCYRVAEPFQGVRRFAEVFSQGPHVSPNSELNCPGFWQPEHGLPLASDKQPTGHGTGWQMGTTCAGS